MSLYTEKFLGTQYRMSDYGDAAYSEQEGVSDVEEDDANDAVSSGSESESDEDAEDAGHGTHQHKRARKGRALSRDQRRTAPILTKYERARILGIRAIQISTNAPLFVPITDGDIDPLRIAMRELKARRLPFTIRRVHPDGTYEDWELRELAIERR